MNAVLLKVALSEVTQSRGFLSEFWWHMHGLHGKAAADDAIQHLITQHGGKRLQVPTASELVGRNEKRIADYCPKFEDLP